MEAVVVQYYRILAEAELDRNRLHEEGIWSMVRHGNLHAYNAASTDAYLVVRPGDLEKAREVLNILKS